VEVKLLSAEKKFLLLREAKFYQLQELVCLLESDLKRSQDLLRESELKRHLDSWKPWELKPSPDGSLSYDKRTFTKNNSGYCRVVGSEGWSSGIHEWSVMVEYGNLVIGITSNTNPASSNDGSTRFNSCSIISSYNHLYGNIGKKAAVFTSEDLKGIKKYSVRLNMEDKTLTFGFDGVWKGIAWSDLPSETYFPLFGVYAYGVIFTVKPLM